MAVDTSIYNALIADRKSVADYDAMRRRSQAEEMNLDTQRMNALVMRQKMDEAQAMQRERETVRNALLGLGANATDEQRIQALKGTGTSSGFTAADALEKALLERMKTQADVKYKGAQTAKEQQSVVDSTLKRYRTALDFIDTPQAAARWMQAQYSDNVLGPHMQGMGPLEDAISRIPQDPAGFNAWRERSAMGMEAYAKKLQEDLKIAETGRHNKASERLTQRGQDVTAATTRRGQDLADARAREGNQIQRDAARVQVLETPDGVMLVDKGTGSTRAAVGPDGKPLQGKPSEAVRKEMMSINQQRAVIDGAIKAAEATPSAFSLARGAATMTGPIAESVAGRFDSDAERQARAFVFNNVSKVINERAGAAQSAQELARLRGFLPAETDRADQVVSKLNAFQAYLDELERGTTGKPPLEQPNLPDNRGRAAGKFKVLGKEQ